jgi:hypothetical protein
MLAEEIMSNHSKRSIFIVVIYLLFLLAACSQSPPYKSQTLPSGRTIKIGGIMQINFSKGDPALMLKYYTDVNVSDSDAITKEVDDIWQSFKNDVEKSGMNAAIISANELPKGIISKTKGCNFVFMRQPNGSWKKVK